MGKARREKREAFNEGLFETVVFGSGRVPEGGTGSITVWKHRYPAGFAGQKNVFDQGAILTPLDSGSDPIVG